MPEADRQTLYGIDARYEGQNFEVHVALDGLSLAEKPDALDREFGERFRAAHRAAYGYDIPGRAVEIVTFLVALSVNLKYESVALVTVLQWLSIHS